MPANSALGAPYAQAGTNSAQGRRGIVTTPHVLATEAGLRVLEEGGTAIDAMIAAGASLCSVYPHMTGIGGDAVWLIDAGQTRCILGIGQAGSKPPMGMRGVGATGTTAGAIRAWQVAREISTRQWKSKLPLSRLFEEAIEHSGKGVSASASQAFWVAQRGAALEEFTDIRHLTRRHDGSRLQQGDCIIQPELAKTLQRLASAGLEDFYTGEVAKALAAGFSRLDNGLGLEDLAATRARHCDPVCVPYRQGTYMNFPAPSQGVFTAQALTTLNQYALAELPAQTRLHLLIEAVKTALAARNRDLCDPETNRFDSLKVAQTANALELSRASKWTEAGQPADTVWLAARDREGRTACLMQSLFHDFGSGCVMGDTGVVWHNRAVGFNPQPGHPNFWAQGKRPAHTLNPSAYRFDDGRHLYFGSQGGDGQPQTQLVLACELIDRQASLFDAFNAPRFIQGRSFFDSLDNLKIEASVDAATLQGLMQLGHDTVVIPALSPLTGQAGALFVDQSGLSHAIHDPRGNGCAMAVSEPSSPRKVEPPC
jgi:gamma-glutamyltranspeptidase